MNSAATNFERKLLTQITCICSRRHQLLASWPSSMWVAFFHQPVTRKSQFCRFHHDLRRIICSIPNGELSRTCLTLHVNSGWAIINSIYKGWTLRVIHSLQTYFYCNRASFYHVKRHSLSKLQEPLKEPHTVQSRIRGWKIKIKRLKITGLVVASFADVLILLYVHRSATKIIGAGRFINEMNSGTKILALFVYVLGMPKVFNLNCILRHAICQQINKNIWISLSLF